MEGGTSLTQPNNGSNIAQEWAGQTASAVGKKILTALSVWDTIKSTISGSDILVTDNVAFKLFNSLGISLNGTKQSLEAKMNKAYSFIESDTDYFTNYLGGPFGNKSLYTLDLEISKCSSHDALIEK
ncbi:hypothetical protein [Clostridium sp. BNL1100]|uniref:hypothetical protein n=1 Tax=Clostridium sp. BNL1100 TaxID=755731 RepID=UPI00024A70F3|nr:hypothetical protein [Clostridium sp. BNL1100]AEY64586.1 hypothetical protein Clo1100_0300 [Clostridium sp. BNL1100]